MVGSHLLVRPSFGPLNRIARAIRSNLPPLNFITIHYAYFIGTCLASAIIFYCSSTPFGSVSFTDSLFLTISAMTLAGLNTVNLSTLNTFQQVVLFLLIMLGSAIFVSAFVVHVRRKAFEVKFKSVVAKQRSLSGNRRRFSLSRARSRGKSFQRTATMDAVPPELDIPDGVRLSHESEEDAKEQDGEQDRQGDGVEKEKLDQPRSGTPVQSSSKQEAAIGPSDGTPPGSEISNPLERSSSRPESQGGQVARTESIHEPNAMETGSQALTFAADPELSVAQRAEDHISFSPGTRFRRPSLSSERPRHHRLFSMQGVGAHDGASLRRWNTDSASIDSAFQRFSMDAAPELGGLSFGKRTFKYFESSGFISRNSQFHHLTEEERERLGGVEYRAIRILSYIVPLYFILWQLLGCLGLGAYVANNRPGTARVNGLNPWWVGAFNAVSAFNNSGMSLLDANMVAFQTSVFMLLTMSLLILAGNTCYPIFLRLIVWTLLKLTPKDDSWKDDRNTLQFLLDHPRRCYTNLFPAQHTWWLFLSVIVLNGTDWAAFEILNIGNKAITSLPAGIEVLDGLFQAFAVRSGGFYVVPIPSVRISLQVLYVVMMYISVYPVVITIRNSNVYEERSLGIYADDPGYVDSESSSDASRGIFGKLKKRFTGASGNAQEHTKSYFVRQQLRAQLAHDLWWLVLAVFLITIVEGSQFERSPAVFSVFNVIFETVSAYGCVGISVGLPDQAYSFCGAWHKLSKLILCAVMLRGRHRGLPVAIDKAVLLPGERLHQAEEEDAQIRLEKRWSRGGMV